MTLWRALCRGLPRLDAVDADERVATVWTAELPLLAEVNGGSRRGVELAVVSAVGTRPGDGVAHADGCGWGAVERFGRPVPEGRTPGRGRAPTGATAGPGRPAAPGQNAASGHVRGRVAVSTMMVRAVAIQIQNS